MGVCSRTGFAYVEGPIVGYRVATTQYGPVSPRQRDGGPRFRLPDTALLPGDWVVHYNRISPVDRAGWSRFDTPGSTIYLADDTLTAYAETLAQFRMGTQDRSAIMRTAETLGCSWEEARKMIADDFQANGNSMPWRLPARWREDRRIYTIGID